MTRESNKGLKTSTLSLNLGRHILIPQSPLAQLWLLSLKNKIHLTIKSKRCIIAEVPIIQKDNELDSSKVFVFYTLLINRTLPPECRLLLN